MKWLANRSAFPAMQWSVNAEIGKMQLVLMRPLLCG